MAPIQMLDFVETGGVTGDSSSQVHSEDEMAGVSLVAWCSVRSAGYSCSSISEIPHVAYVICSECFFPQTGIFQI